MTCPRCGLPAPTNEMAAYGCHENEWVDRLRFIGCILGTSDRNSYSEGQRGAVFEDEETVREWLLSEK